jgi:hypothetical protein
MTELAQTICLHSRKAQSHKVLQQVTLRPSEILLPSSMAAPFPISFMLLTLPNPLLPGAEGAEPLYALKHDNPFSRNVFGVMGVCRHTRPVIALLMTGLRS